MGRRIIRIKLPHNRPQPLQYYFAQRVYISKESPQIDMAAAEETYADKIEPRRPAEVDKEKSVSRGVRKLYDTNGIVPLIYGYFHEEFPNLYMITPLLGLTTPNINKSDGEWRLHISGELARQRTAMRICKRRMTDALHKITHGYGATDENQHYIIVLILKRLTECYQMLKNILDDNKEIIQNNATLSRSRIASRIKEQVEFIDQQEKAKLISTVLTEFRDSVYSNLKRSPFITDNISEKEVLSLLHHLTETDENGEGISRNRFIKGKWDEEKIQEKIKAQDCLLYTSPSPRD